MFVCWGGLSLLLNKPPSSTSIGMASEELPRRALEHTVDFLKSRRSRGPDGWVRVDRLPYFSGWHFSCYYRNRELPSSSHLWDTQAFFSQESPVKARSNTVFTVFLCRSERPTFLWDSWVLSALILLWLGRFTYIASDFRYGSFKMVVSSVFGYQVFRSI